MNGLRLDLTVNTHSGIQPRSRNNVTIQSFPTRQPLERFSVQVYDSYSCAGDVVSMWANDDRTIFERRGEEVSQDVMPPFSFVRVCVVKLWMGAFDIIEE